MPGDENKEVNFETEFRRRIFTQNLHFNDPLENLRIAIVLKKIPQNNQVPSESEEDESQSPTTTGIKTPDGIFWTNLISWQQKVFSPECVFHIFCFLFNYIIFLFLKTSTFLSFSKH